MRSILLSIVKKSNKMIVYGNEISSDYIRYSSGEIKKFNSIIIDYESVVD